MFLNRAVTSFGSQYLLESVSDSRSSIALFSLSIKSWLVKTFFFVETWNFNFLPLFVWESSLPKIVEKGIISSKHFMQCQTNKLFSRNLFVCKFISLHLMCTHSWQWSHWAAWWFFGTALLQILHGNFTTIFFQRELWNEISVREQVEQK